MNDGIGKTTYLGEGIYACHDGWQIELWADSPDLGRQTVYLDREVYQRLVAWVGRLEGADNKHEQIKEETK